MAKKITKNQTDVAKGEKLLKCAIFAYNQTEKGKEYNLKLIKHIAKDETIEKMAKIFKISVEELEKGHTLDEQAEIIFNHKMRDFIK